MDVMITKCRVTQYGLSKKAGGWDGVGDSGTDEWLGNHGNTLFDGFSCALTQAAQDALGIACKPGVLILIEFDDGTTQVRRFDDRAPESDSRLDMFNAYRIRPQGSDFANLSLLFP